MQLTQIDLIMSNLVQNCGGNSASLMSKNPATPASDTKRDVDDPPNNEGSIHRCMSPVDSESSSRGNEVRHRSLQSTCRGSTYPGPGIGRLDSVGSSCLVVDRRCLPVFLPRITWERMIRLSERPILPGLWSMNCSAMAEVMMISCNSRSRPVHLAGSFSSRFLDIRGPDSVDNAGVLCGR